MTGKEISNSFHRSGEYTVEFEIKQENQISIAKFLLSLPIGINYELWNRLHKIVDADVE